MSGDKHNLRVGDYLEHIVTAIEKINRYGLERRDAGLCGRENRSFLWCKLLLLIQN
jgi:hypothetical protein